MTGRRYQRPAPLKYHPPVDTGLSEEEMDTLFGDLVKASPSTLRTGICGVDRCSQRLWESTPLCKEHAFDLWQKVELAKEENEDEIDAARQRRINHEEHKKHLKQIEEEALKEAWREQFEEDERLAKSKSKPGVIYYLRVGELIKIGFSVDLESRIRSYPPDSKILAVHPGTPEVERTIHNKFFNHLKHGREWFTPSPEIDQHIQEVRKQFPQHNKI